jgi:hypothetical protein
MRLFNSGLVFTCGAMVGFSGIENAAAASETGNGVLEEIVVTAQKREQNLKDVPISVVVVSGESLSKQNLKGLGDLTAQIPNIYVARGTITDTLYIRGAGSGNNIGFEQSVATFVDASTMVDRGIHAAHSWISSGWKCCAVRRVPFSATMQSLALSASPHAGRARSGKSTRWALTSLRHGNLLLKWAQVGP